MTFDSKGKVSDPNESSDTANIEQNEVSNEELISGFPVLKLQSLNQKINSPRWVVPVLPDQELEVLLNYAIKLSKAGIDYECEPCVKFYREGLTISFMKILTDEAVNSWKVSIHSNILMLCGKLLELCSLHMKADNLILLDLLAMVFDTDNKFHTHNAARGVELFNNQESASEGAWGTLFDNQLFARSPTEPQSRRADKPFGWLVDLINRFGQLGGFDNFLERFNAGISVLKKHFPNEEINDETQQQSSSSATTENLNATNSEEINKLTLPLIYYLLRPFGQCYELFTQKTIEKYFQPIWKPIIEILNNMSDEDLKRDAKLDGKNDIVNGIIKYSKMLISRCSNAENLIRELEMCRLKIILRVLQISSFNGKMNALNEINKMLSYVSYYPHRHHQSDDECETMTAEKLAKWIKDVDVLGIVLKDSLHQPQYVEKLEKIVRFLIKEKSLSLEDLAAIWRAQAGKHEAIVKNVHDLLAKLAWDFNAEQLDYLFDCFQTSMKTANKKQRERLLELNRRLAEDDKNGVMADKVLKLFWSLAHSPDIKGEVLDQALASHVKILDYSCSQDKDLQKPVWLNKCVEELKKGDDEWALPALRLIREICCLYEPTPNHMPRTHSISNRQQVIDRLQNEHTLVILVTNSLTRYMEKIHELVKNNKNLKPMEIVMDKRYPHPQQIQERLDFLKFLLKDGQLWLCADQAKQIWQCLAVNAAFPSDREECFRWFGKLMGDEPDLDPGINKDFFENNVLQLDPQLLTESGIKCFERFFKAVNTKEEKLKAKNRGYVLDDEDLIGKDYLWQVITNSGEEIAFKAIELLKEVSTALGPRLLETIIEFHENFITDCCDKIKITSDRIIMLSNALQDSAKDKGELQNRRMMEADRICRILRVIEEYIKECDRTFNGDRQMLNLSRASRGKHICLYIRFQTNGRQLDDIEVTTHTNETVFSFKRNLLRRLKGNSMNNIKIDLYNQNGDLIEINDERHPLSMYNIRDKTAINVKLSPMGNALASSPDSSSDSSTGSPPRPCPDMQKLECEATLPGVIISQSNRYLEFFLQLHQLGCDLSHSTLRECSRSLLHLLPMDTTVVANIHRVCISKLLEKRGGDVAKDDSLLPEAMFLNVDSAHVLYNLEVLQALLIPAIDPHGESTLRLQLSWLHSGVAHFILDLLTKNNFMPNADVHSKRSAYQCILKLIKLFLTIIGYVLSRVGDEPASTVEKNRNHVEILKQTLITMGNSDHTMKAIATKLAQNLSDEMLSESEEGENCRQLFKSALGWSLPDITTLRALVNLAWASSTGSFHLLSQPEELMGKEMGLPEAMDFAVCKEALEVLSFSLVLNHKGYEALSSDEKWSNFIISLVLVNGSKPIRQTASEQIFFTCTYCSADRRPFDYMVKLMVDTLKTKVLSYSSSCSEFFQLFCRILKYGFSFPGYFNLSEHFLTQEIEWIRTIRENVKKTGETGVHEELLEGRLALTKELMAYLKSETKSQLSDLILEIVDDFIFPSSKQYLNYRKTGQLSDITAPPPVCRSSQTISAASELLIALSCSSVSNMKLLVNTLLEMFCFEIEPLHEWEYLPPIGPRQKGGFCGLKNAGATCYMNSVLQQLFMVPSIRIGILSSSGACIDEDEDFSGELDSRAIHDTQSNNENSQQNYHIGILKHVQAIFAYLGHSAHQFYIPRGLWGHFKLQGEPVNLREQQDAVEFFMSLFESLDEGLKALGHPQLMGATLGGIFSDQKICQECPHRYSKEEPFSVFSIDIRNHSSLTDSLEQYVKGELLEGADAYHCDKCDKKVVTIKRMCVRKLPPVLAIQLKRFEYDYERVCAIKFNDYFEFPRFLDMEPYTVSGLAKIEGTIADIDDFDGDIQNTKYQLSGIVVHSGQASGGHYYSYIMHKNESGNEIWYKFDDGEVTECKINEDEELKAQCFGGDYMGEVYDNNLKRMQYRRQKRWWNAYMLFYTSVDQKQIPLESCIEQLSLAESKNFRLPMPSPIEKSLRLQNIKFLHSRSLFSAEFFSFIRNLVGTVIPRSEKMTPQSEELSLLSVQLASQFLFQFGFRTKKALRGASLDWFEVLSPHIRYSAIVRRWFAANALLSPSNRLAEYVLIATSLDIRAVFVKIIVFFCHFANQDKPLANFDGSTLCEQILQAVLNLLVCDASDYGKHLPHYFNLFVTYALLGVYERHQLIKLNVPAIFMKVALDEGPGPAIKYQYPEFNKLHQCVSMLIRSCDISSRCQGSNAALAIKRNVYIDTKVTHDQLLPLSQDAEELLFNRTSYIKKLIEDTNIGEEGLKLLQYCSWENPQFSQALLTELLWHCGFAYWHDMRHHTELLLHILLMEDSWQHHRIHNALMGVSEDREGLLDTIQRNRNNYQKRAYQCIKCLVQLFRKSPVALQILQANAQIMRSWSQAVDWLHDELERQRGSQFNYSSWSPPTQSNESTNTYALERSQSARNVLQMAFELCPDDEQDEPNDSEIETSEDFKSGSASNINEASDMQTNTSNLGDDEINKTAERIENLRVKNEQEISSMDESTTTSSQSTVILAEDLNDADTVDVAPAKLLLKSQSLQNGENDRK